MKNLFYFLFLSVFIFCSCGSDNDDIKLKESEVSLKSGEKYTIKVSSDTKVTYFSENEYVAVVSEDGIVTANKVGETSVLLDNGSDKKTFKVKVEPKYNLYADPELNFGMSKTDLIKKYGTPNINEEEEEEGSSVVYQNYSKAAPLVMYLFDENEKLTASYVTVNAAHSKELNPFLSERYVYMDDYAETFIYINSFIYEEATLAIAAFFDEDLSLVGYTSIDDDQKTSISENKQDRLRLKTLFNRLK